MTKEIVSALNPDAIFNKSKVYIRRALSRKKDNDLDEYQLWASLALELLSKSSLARVHPSLIADPLHSPSLFAASGISKSTDIKTIAAHTLYERLRTIAPSFDEKAKKFCLDISQRRNTELHSGETPFKAMKADAWEAHYWHCAYVVLETMKITLDDWLGATEARAPKDIVSHAKDAKIKAVSVRVERHKENFKSCSKKEREAALAAAEGKRAHHYTKLFTLLSDKEWETRCPACGGKAFSAGDKISEEVVENDDNREYDGWETVEKTYSGEQFHCPVCELWLDGIDELEAADIDTSYSEYDEREMHYEPDYGND